MGPARRIACLAFAVAIFFPNVPSAFASGRWDDAAGGLAGQIAGRLSRNAAITLEVNNRSALDANEIAETTAALRAQLTARHIRVIATKRPVPNVAVTISENAQGILWIAEVQHDNSHDVVMVQTARPLQASQTVNSEPLVIRPTLIIEKRAPILDLAEFTSGEAQPLLLVLDTEKVELYGKSEASWVLRQSLPLKRSQPWPRDPRGRLVLGESGTFNAFTPRTECQGTTNPTLTMDCAESEAGWPVGRAEPGGTVAHLVSDKNYFDGKIKVAGDETRVPEFFTAVSVGPSPAVFRIYANLDGRARMFGKGPQPAGQFDGWGSDITSVRSGCGNGFQVLATRPVSMGQADAIQAFSIRGREAVPAGAPAEFRGPVTALWPAQDGAMGMAVVHDLSTGMFDAFSLVVSCGR